MTHSRRELLGRGLLLAGLAATGSARAQNAACYDPATLPLSQRSRRRAVSFVEASGDAAVRCGNCAFFTVTADPCGTCSILGGGPTQAGAVCSSFAPKGK
ncbi:MAG: hypothetical protein KGL44_11180 [Sphingomonadales bacterium]|nr:hypothetical protein [Sphingomonadales bacterium]